MTLTALQLLASARPEEAADVAARVLGISPAPAEVAAPVTGARPGELVELAAEWRRVVHRFDDHTAQLDDAAQRAFGSWRGAAADATAEYVSGLVAALGAQRGTMAEVADALEQVGAELEQAAREIRDASDQAGAAIVLATLTTLATVTVLALTPGAEELVPAAIEAGLELVAVLVMSVAEFVHSRARTTDAVEAALAHRLDLLSALGGPDRIRAVATPRPPELVDVTAAFDHRAFYSEHMPAE
ncbi:MAG TPA: hypothetical protein VGD72_16275 [Mycobacteriales bacterium]|jgi:hypothetical protein